MENLSTLGIRISVILLMLVFISCQNQRIKREQYEVEDARKLSKTDSYLKVHMRNGHVYVLNQWSQVDIDSVLLGMGVHLDFNRREIEKTGEGVGQFRIPYSEVALIETNDVGNSLSGGLVAVAVVTTTVSVICAVDPKACFGSCPTIYTHDNGSLVAEAFSSSILPSLEDSDVDWIGKRKIRNSEFRLTVKNEAYETHMINQSEVLVFEDQGKEIHRDVDQNYWQADQKLKPLFHPELTQLDGVEYYSQADGQDLRNKEELILEFEEAVQGRFGVLIGKRQSLMTTYLFYQGLSYMGKQAVEFLAQVETDPEMRSKLRASEKETNMFNVLGGIEVYGLKDYQWIKIGEVFETGPIAVDQSMVVGFAENPINIIKLVMTKGLWRIDKVNLLSIEKEVFPEKKQPFRLLKNGINSPELLEELNSGEDYIHSLPGDEFELSFQIPEGSYYLFTKNRGYYLEWLREEWLQKQDLRKVKLMMEDPGEFVSEETDNFKARESTMESVFWNSKYVKAN